ncbi:MAG: hypothetical protein AAF608_11560 [Pseudomonadota bacterium]
MRLVSVLVGLLAWATGAAAQELPPARIAVVGGTFINDEIYFRDLIQETAVVETKMGPSVPIAYAEYEGIPFYYVHMHGSAALQATWVALYNLGVVEVIGGATAGAINPEMAVLDYIIPDDFIDLNINRPLNFPREIYKNPDDIPLPRFVPAMDPDLREILLSESASALGSDAAYKDIELFDGGIVMQARGGRFETAAEIAMMAQWGGDVVTMNVATEMAYARMLGMNYACIIVISNPAEGVADWEFSSMPGVYQLANPLSLDIVLASLDDIVALEGKPRVSDSLRLHPKMTSRPDEDDMGAH